MSNLKTRDEYAEICFDLVDNPANISQRKMWNAFDDMYACAVTIPAEIKDLVGSARFVTTLPRSGVDAVTRFLSTRNPTLKLRPMLPDPQEHERLEFGEVVLQWNWNRMNEAGKMPVRTQILKDLALYGKCVIRTRYVPYEAKKGTYTPAQVRRMKRYGDFQFVRYSPHGVYENYVDDEVASIVGVSVISLKELKDKYEHKNVEKVINKESKRLKSEPDAEFLRSNYVTLFDFMDEYCSCLLFTFNGQNKDVNTDGDVYELKRKEHKLGFLPWIVEEFSSPILSGLYHSQLYNQIAVLRTIFQAKTLQMVAEEDTIISAPNPDDPNLQATGENLAGEKTVGPGVSVSRLQPHQIDPNLMSAINMLEREASSSMAVSALVAIEQYIGGNTPFSSINAAQSTAAAHLGPIQNAAERLISKGLSQELRWIWTSNTGTMGYREKKAGDDEFTRMGARFLLRKFMPDQPKPNQDVIEFDPDELFVEAKLNPMMIQDRQSESNLALIKQQAGLSFATSTEHLIDDPNAEILQRGVETLLGSRIKADTMKIEAEGQAEAIIATARQTAQMIMAQMQQQQQQAQPQQGGAQPTPQTMVNNANSGAATAAMKGRDVRQGAPPEAAYAPGEGATQTTGRAPGGQELA